MNLLATKFHRPALMSKWVHRPLLIQKLNEGLNAGRQLTLVSAPAGFGKSTCVSEWVTSLDLPVSWLSLESADDDPGRFFAYFLAALRNADPAIGKEIEGILRAGQIPPIETWVTPLLNDIVHSERKFLLVLDDLHVIRESGPWKALGAIVANQPENFHLVLITREDPPLPLARLRANNQVTEIRAGDLRFDNLEANHLLNEIMGLHLSDVDVASLEDRTEGWAVGLQLAGLSIRDRADPTAFIAALSGSHRYILGYLTEEVLSRQPEEIEQFLLDASILERLNGDLCDAVTGRSGSAALLEKLYSANLFLISLDDEQHWYRYHHLFADLLRSRQKSLQKERTAELHRRAARWYEQAGMVHEAIRHALSAADFQSVVHLLESHAIELLLQGYARSVEGWMQAIPAEWRDHSPRVHLACAWTHLLRGAFQQATAYGERLKEIFSNPELSIEIDPSLRAEWLAFQSLLLNAQGKAAESLTLANQALTIVPEKEAYVRSMIYMGLAGAYQLMDDDERAIKAFQKIIQYGRAAGNFICEMLGFSGLIQMALNHGHLRLASEVASQGIERIEQVGMTPPISAAAYGGLGQVYYERNQLEPAHTYFQRSIHISKLSGYSDAEIGYEVVLSRLFQAEGNLQAAYQKVQKAAVLMENVAPAWAREEVIAQQIRVQLALGHLAQAEVLLKQQGISLESPLQIHGKINHATGLVYNSALRILLYKAFQSDERPIFQQALTLADDLVEGALQGHYHLITCEALQLRAQIYAALDNKPACQADYIKALQLGEPEGYIRIFIEEGGPTQEALEILLKRNLPIPVQPGYIRAVLAAFSRQPILRSHAEGKGESGPGSDRADDLENLVEPLTERELEVLHLIAAGLKYEEIAEKLFISLNTVRTYVKAIYSKLNVNSRAKAVLLAQQKRLI